MTYVHQDSSASDLDPRTLPPLDLPHGLTSRYVDCTPQSLVFHIIESFPQQPTPDTQLILCVHGFPELAYSWRKVLPLLSSRGYHAVAFDQRGFGRTHSSKPVTADTFRPLSLIKDTMALVLALGYSSVRTIVGHDFGAITAGLCVLSRPDMFQSLVLMGHPIKQFESFPYSTSPSLAHQKTTVVTPDHVDIQHDLAQLSPPRKHYKWYYSSEFANAEMTYPAGQALHEFLRGYFYLKSADAPQQPAPLKGWTAEDLQRLPRYYIMDQDGTMRDNVVADLAGVDPQAIRERTQRWLPDRELAVYVDEYTRTTFRGGLNWYKVQTDPEVASDSAIWTGCKIRVPTMYLSGKSDWATFQQPGAVDAMETGISVEDGCFKRTVLVDRAGHWVIQEQPERCAEEILRMAAGT
ncbi:uncharacterized protein HMPREF1541_10994 [Cyphellophora europaea CBS 101466]|uniref:AB hydrolase-1 domain-containing protein n=1 Tax=Cyphellophora europaea (strain CBS 101466) TaxID=1220924 RepID=W2S764_CYPE1|nr:uncharacterized protein HMPREF1541_10994 [Cyphellophora europaea CBS 101466]ETN43863.1 hypothetical protein HMPREF1541_10994 [Cyphellophora europaea CBS 101466]